MSKFSNPTDEALHRMTLDGTAETVGEVNDFGRHYSGLGSVDRSELGDAAGEFPASSFVIVEEDSSGFVSVHLFADESGYRAAMDRAEADYAAFADAP
ncbi:hypothetical protein [Mycolicibacterium sp.]|uniref:hypothetical protein n=1 Tax=Mycolicibacterium sp. TaxID=2320850 RepID=UPI00355EB6AF